MGTAPNPGRLEERSDRELDVIGKFGPGQEEHLEVGIEDGKQDAKTASLVVVALVARPCLGKYLRRVR